MHVVFRVRRGHDHRPGSRRSEYVLLEPPSSRGGSRCSITSTSAAASNPIEPLVAIGQRAVQAARSAAAGRRACRRGEPLRGRFQRSYRDVDADNLLVVRPDQTLHQSAATAAEVEHAARARGRQRPTATVSEALIAKRALSSSCSSRTGSSSDVLHGRAGPHPASAQRRARARACFFRYRRAISSRSG